MITRHQSQRHTFDKYNRVDLFTYTQIIGVKLRSQMSFVDLVGLGVGNGMGIGG